MFVRAVEIAAEFTRPVHTIVRYHGSTETHPHAATLFFVNSDGWALTCRHVAEQFTEAEELHKRYAQFRAERDALRGKKRSQMQALGRRLGLTGSQVVEMKYRFVDCITGPLEYTVTTHPSFDVALVQFLNYTDLLCSTFPVFAANGHDLKQGRFLCRLGFPFPEFSNYAYDETTDTIEWTQQGRVQTPRFPIEGMVTRLLAGPEGSVIGFELSTPGLMGQSGGPAFDTEGRVWGMQVATAHLDLHFDVDTEVVREGRKRRVKESAFLHVGQCLHVDVLKKFMSDCGVAFVEG